MFVQLPPEIIDQIIECLPSKQDTCSIALACSALRPHAYRRLFRRLAVFVDGGNIVPTSAELILFYPHLLQYPTRLFIWHALLSKRRSVYSQKHGDIPTIPVHYIWSHLIDMPHLTSLNLCLSTSYYGAVLSTLERLDAGRNITLDLSEKLQHDVSMSENSLPVKCLTLPMDEPSHQLGKQLLQKCSQSLFELRLHLEGLCTPDFPFLPHLRVFSLRVTHGDLTPWLPFFMKHSSLTSVTLDNNITSINPVPPDLLPELQYLEAHPLVVERLIPGRPVHTVAIFTTTCLPDKLPSSYNTIFQSFTLPCAPVTTLDITVDAFQSAKLLVDTIRSLPMLRSLCFSVGYKFPFTLDGVLQALGKCRYMQFIEFRFSDYSQDGPGQGKFIWSRDDIVSMIATIQESGANDLRRFEILGATLHRQERCTAERIGWLSVASQPNLKGEWKISVTESCYQLRHLLR